MSQYTETIKFARRLLDEYAGEQCGYGYYRPENPHDFTPDGDNTEEEIAAHAAACKAWDDGAYKPGLESGWLSDQWHITVAPWGPGSYVIRDPEVQACIAEIDALLKAENASDD